MYHMGVIKALIENGAMPASISSTLPLTLPLTLTLTLTLTLEP